VWADRPTAKRFPKATPPAAPQVTSPYIQDHISVADFVDKYKRPKLQRCNAMGEEQLREAIGTSTTSTTSTTTPGLPDWDAKMIQLSSAQAQMLCHAIEQNTLALQKLGWEFELLFRKKMDKPDKTDLDEEETEVNVCSNLSNVSSGISNKKS
jgi:hypothetical protein